MLLDKEQATGQACRKIGISENIFYKWRKEYGGMRINQAKWLKELEKETAHTSDT